MCHEKYSKFSFSKPIKVCKSEKCSKGRTRDLVAKNSTNMICPDCGALLFWQLGRKNSSASRARS